jgi:hypothetical protein
LIEFENGCHIRLVLIEPFLYVYVQLKGKVIVTVDCGIDEKNLGLFVFVIVNEKEDCVARIGNYFIWLVCRDKGVYA